MATAILAGCAGLPAAAPTPAPVAVQAPRAEALPERRRDSFIQSYGAGVGAETARLRAAGLGSAWEALRPIVDAHLDTSNDTRPEAPILRPLRVDSMTNLLLVHGYRADHLANLAQARLIVQAADLSGQTDSADLVRLAPTVVVANMEGVREAKDGSTQLVYRVIEPLKNAPPKGSVISLTLSGPRAASPFPPPPQPGEEELRVPGKVVLLLAPPRPVPEALTRDTYVRMAQLRIEEEKVLPSYHSGAPETTLARLREAIREQVCAPGFVPVGAATGQSLAC